VHVPDVRPLPAREEVGVGAGNEHQRRLVPVDATRHHAQRAREERLGLPEPARLGAHGRLRVSETSGLTPSIRAGTARMTGVTKRRTALIPGPSAYHRALAPVNETSRPAWRGAAAAARTPFGCLRERAVGAQWALAMAVTGSAAWRRPRRVLA